MHENWSMYKSEHRREMLKLSIKKASFLNSASSIPRSLDIFILIDAMHFDDLWQPNEDLVCHTSCISLIASMQRCQGLHQIQKYSFTLILLDFHWIDLKIFN